MTRIRPFRALRYGRPRLDAVLVPPYDVITPDERVAYYDRDPHNAIRLELTRDVADEADTDYADVARTVADWQRDGVLVRDPQPGLYGLRQRFEVAGGGTLVREGFFAELHLEDYGARVVLPHERTLAGPKADRLKMIRATRANLSVIFMLFEDRENQVAEALAPAFSGPPLAQGQDPSGVDNTLVRVVDPEAVAAVEGALSERPVVIADGHHRYETALAYRDECRAEGAGAEAPSEWALVYFANAFAPGSLLLPIHRVILKGSAPTAEAWRGRLPGWEMRELALRSADDLPALLAEHLTPLADRHAFAADDGQGVLRVFWRARDEELTIRAIHREVVEGVFGLDEEAVRQGAVAYPKTAIRAGQEVRAGRGVAALYLNPLTPDDVFRVTGAGEILPQKSTFFQPKLPTGLVFRRLDP